MFATLPFFNSWIFINKFVKNEKKDGTTDIVEPINEETPPTP
jgi:hypothetical protein